MAAIPMELAVLGLGAAGSVVIPAAAGGIAAAVARGKMKPTKVKVADVNELRPGDHVSHKLGAFSSQHYIVVEAVGTGSKPKLAFVTGKQSEAVLQCEDTDLSSHLESLFRHDYTHLMCFPGDYIAARARSLTEEYNASNRHSAIRNYWKFFKDDEHFAVWCQTGMDFAAVMRGMMSTDYKYSVVKSIWNLREGDHVCYRVGVGSYEHGIVVKICADDMSIDVVYLSGKPNPTPQVTKIGIDIFIRKGQLYRYDYDIGVGDDAHDVISRAANEIERAMGTGCYRNDVEFAVWCKTTMLCSPNDASTLAAARVLGHVYAPVVSKKMLKIGDHISYNSGKVYYYQHAIVVAVLDTKLDVVFLPGNVDVHEKLSIARETIDVAEYMRKKQLYKYFYDVGEWLNTNEVLARAEEQVGALVCNRPFKDPLQFAIWCKTGSYQLHTRAAAVELED